MKMKVIVDHIIGDTAVIKTEANQIFNIPVALIPAVGKGDIVTIEITKSETDSQRHEMRNLMHSVWEDVD